MKNKIKNIIFIISIFIMIIALIYIIISLINIKNLGKNIMYIDEYSYEDNYQELYQKANNISNIECQKEIITAIDESKNLFFSSTMNPKEVVKIIDDNSTLSNYLNIKTSCNISNDTTYINYSDIVNIAYFYTNLKDYYNTNYHYSLSNNFYSSKVKETVLNTRLASIKTIEINNLKNIIEEVNTNE